MVSESEDSSAQALMLNVITLRSFMRVVHRQNRRETAPEISLQVLDVWSEHIHARIHRELLIGNQDYSIFEVLRHSINDVKYLLVERYKPEQFGYDVICMAALSNPVLMIIDVAPKTIRIDNTLPSLLLH